jgi:F-type H+-transporting ATPase subunit alpha
MTLADQVAVIYAVTNGFLDDVEIRKVKDFEEAFLRYMGDTQPELWQRIQTGAKLDDETQAALDQAIDDFKATAAY